MTAPWYRQRWLIVLVLFLGAVPLLWPQIPPLVDVPGHLGRYRVELDLSSSPTLRQFYSYHWSVIGNLGVDLLIIPVAQVFGLEVGVKLIVICIPVLTIAGLLLVAREVHGQIPPTIFFALPFAYGYPFNFGFINFSLSMAFALLAFALWLRLGFSQKRRFRAVLFIPVSCAVWLTHAFGWGVLGLLVWSSELVRHRDSGKAWIPSALHAGIDCIPLSVPFVLMLIWRAGGAQGDTRGFFDVLSKVFSLAAALRDRWLLWDCLSVAVAVVLIGSALFDGHLEISRKLGIPAIVLAAIFVLLPREVFGSAYADMRVGPYMLMLALAAIRMPGRENVGSSAILPAFGLAFFLLRIAGNSLSFALADSAMHSELGALEYVPAGSRVLSIVGDSCGTVWAMPRYSHLGSLVITRKLGFSNDQWQLPGAQLLKVTYSSAGQFAADPSELTYSRKCQQKLVAKLPKGWKPGRTADQVLDLFPRNAFDYVWMIRPEGLNPRPHPDLVPVWRSSNSILYKVAAAPK